MEDSVIVNEFLNYLQYEKRFSDHTAKCYGVDLAQFSEFLTSRSEAGSGGGDAAGSDSMTGSRSGGAAVATQTRVDINGLLVAADVNTIRSYMAVLNEKQYSKATIAQARHVAQFLQVSSEKKPHKQQPCCGNQDTEAGEEAASVPGIRRDKTAAQYTAYGYLARRQGQGDYGNTV